MALQFGLSTHVIQNLDFSSMKAAAQFFQICSPYTKKQVDARKDKSNALEQATRKLVGVMLGEMCEEDETLTKMWFPACEEAVQALYHIHPCPDTVLGTVISSMYAAFAIPKNKENKEKPNLANSELESADVVDGTDTDTESPRILCSNSRLARFMFVLGQTALNSLVLSDRLGLKAKKYVIDAVKREAAAASNDGTADPEEDAENTAAIDAQHDNIHTYTTEHAMVIDSNNLLGKFHPIVALVVANQGNNFSASVLRESAVLALCKFMSVSSVLCEKYLPLLFTALEQEEGEACRTTILIAFGDLMMRFPNSMEAWTAFMYARLSDDKVVVRYNALMVLTHLILNDMVKVKGQVAHVVMCLTDKDVRIRDLAHVLFTKLSERSNNPVYNLLGDIIGIICRENQSAVNSATTQEAGAVEKAEKADAVEVIKVAALSADTMNYPKRMLSPREFQETMHFLLSFVKKDKQADSMLERLLVRLSLAQSLRQRRSLAYCISELTVTEKGVKKMADMIKGIKDALYGTYGRTDVEAR